MYLLRRSLYFVKRWSSQTPTRRDVRNIGIIAHIDAGKTTVSERMLFLAGATPFIGDVDSGNTVTDYLDIERERGITVQSAAVSFKWKNSLVNLIDTPGHVDFTLEVESCTRILDGVVTVLDSKAGVQAQTRTVWKQASKFNLPSLFFINKMDKNGADTNHVLKTIEEKLNVKGLLTVYPIYKNGSLYGFLDLLNKKMLRTDTEEWTEIPNTHMDEFFQKREDLFYQVADLDNLFMSHFFDGCSGNCKLIDENYFINALHDIILNRKGALVTCGSALHFPSSVSPLLDQVTRFLPAADLIEKKLATVFGNDFSAFVFKIGHEQRKGQLSYLRLYTGSLHSGSTVYNINREQTEGPLRLFAAHADSLKPVNTVNAGEIAVVSGLKNTLTGDTLVSSKSLSKNLAVGDSTKDQLRACNNSVVFSGIDIPSPVYFCCIEPPSASSIHQFEKALFQISTEDPSVKIRRDKETGQTIIETMGELHLEIIKDKFNREYGLNVFIGELGVSYREMITTSVSHRASVMDEQGESSKTHKASLGMLIEPKSGAGAFKRIAVSKELPPIRYEWQKAISEGCSNALHNGPILGFPVQDIIITLQELNVSGGKINSAVLSSCAHKCITESLELAEACLTEPLMKIEVDVDDNSCGTQALLQELSKRRSQILHCDQQYGIGEKIIALVPLAEMKGLSSVVRTLTSGLANLHVQIDKYVKVNKHDEQSIISKLPMIYDLRWLIYGPRSVEHCFSNISLMSKLLLVNMYRHRIDAPTVAELRESAIELLRSANCPNVLIEIFNNSMDIILAIDNSLGYFVLFCTVQIEAESLLNSIYRGSLNQHLIAGHSKNYIDVIPGNSIFCQNEVPWLPWDITSALEDLTVSNHSSKPKYIYDDNAEAGQLSQSFTTILASQKLRLSASRYKPRSLVLGNDSDDEEILTFYTFSPSQMLFDLVVMYEGHSSDLFQKTHNEHFFLCENCEIKDKDLCWQLKESASLLEPHVNSANRLLQLKNNPAFVRASGAKKSISSICEKQLSAISKIMHDKASNYNNLVLLLQNFLDTARDMERMLQFCITILTTCESLYDLSAAIRKMYLLTNEKQYKILLNDFNKAVVLDLSTYLTQPDSAIPLESYIKLFFGASTEGKKLSRLPEEIFKDDIMREITTTMRIAKKMKDSLHSTEDYDQHYAESLKLSTYFKNLEEILTDMDSLGLPRMLHYILKPFSSQKIIDALVVDFKEAMKLIALVFLPLSNHRMLHENEITPKNLLSYGISRRHISRLILGKGILLYDAPPPLDLIISEQHSARYSHIREQFILLSSAYKALLEINLRNNLFCPGEDRIAFFRRNNMISIVRSLLNHVVSMVRIIKIEMEVKLKKVGSVSDLVTIQRHVIRHLFQRIRLETKNTSTSRIITLIADHVHIFSAAFTQGDARSCDIHYSNFSDCIRVLSEKLGTETDNNYAKMLLVQFDRWGFVNSRRSESCSTSRSFISLEDSTSS